MLNHVKSICENIGTIFTGIQAVGINSKIGSIARFGSRFSTWRLTPRQYMSVTSVGDMPAITWAGKVTPRVNLLNMIA